jgi:hypothetical protein
VAVSSVNRSQEAAPSIVSPADYRDWRAQTRTLEPDKNIPGPTYDFVTGRRGCVVQSAR